MSIALDAILVEDRPLTDADIRRRIANGRPSFSTSPDRNVLPLPSLPLPMPGVSPVPMGLKDTPVEDPGGIYLQVALYLTTWSQANPGACDPKDFGELPEDFAGKGGPRTTSALVSFQRWANGRGAHLRTDGALDRATFVLLSEVAGEVAAAPLAQTPRAQGSTAQSAGVPWWVWAGGAAAIALLFRRELGF